MLWLLATRESHPLAATLAFALTLTLALLAVYWMQRPSDRQAVRQWLRRAPRRAGASLLRALSPGLWWSALGRHPRAWVTVAALLLLLTAGPLGAYHACPRFRLWVAFVRVSGQAGGPGPWAAIIREGRPAIPFLISRFSAGETPEGRGLDRRLDAALRLTLDWLHWRQTLTTTPRPAEPAPHDEWQRWWQANAAHVPPLGRDDAEYERWRQLRSGPPATRPESRG
jgi:hypothetical protein